MNRKLQDDLAEINRMIRAAIRAAQKEGVREVRRKASNSAGRAAE
jgi:hypothetical protein